MSSYGSCIALKCTLSWMGTMAAELGSVMQLRQPKAAGTPRPGHAFSTENWKRFGGKVGIQGHSNSEA